MTHKLHFIILFLIAIGLWACSPASITEPTPSVTAHPPTETPVVPTATPILPTATATPLACLTQPGHLETITLAETKPPQEAIIYLPPCYDVQTDLYYPVLYLLHGQTFIDDQWVRLGAPTIADKLIISGQAAPFIMVYPDDRYWNLPAGTEFGQRLTEYLIPYVDSHYRTLSDRQHRALGGLSRGAGWALHLELTHPKLFGILGLHSPAIFSSDQSKLGELINAIPSDAWPRVYIDVGDSDSEQGYAQLFADLLLKHDVAYDWHLYTGSHDEAYWSSHVEEYLRWYTSDW
jgi:enterochelin esterase-like enzyme